jgi:hypothetical protein
MPKQAQASSSKAIEANIAQLAATQRRTKKVLAGKKNSNAAQNRRKKETKTSATVMQH